MFDWQKTILSQYEPYEDIKLLVGSFAEAMDIGSDFDAMRAARMDIDTAVGEGLDVIGRWVGLSRYIPVGLAGSGPYIGFKQQYAGNPNATPQTWGHGTWFRGGRATQYVRLDDEPFRQAIRVKALANISDNTITALNKMLSLLFGARGRAFVRDNGAMKMDFVFNFELTDIEKYLLSSGAVIPKIDGVKASIVVDVAAYVQSFLEHFPNDQYGPDGVTLHEKTAESGGSWKWIDPDKLTGFTPSVDWIPFDGASFSAFQAAWPDKALMCEFSGATNPLSSGVYNVEADFVVSAGPSYTADRSISFCVGFEHRLNSPWVDSQQWHQQDGSYFLAEFAYIIPESGTPYCLCRIAALGTGAHALSTQEYAAPVNHVNVDVYGSTHTLKVERYKDSIVLRYNGTVVAYCNTNGHANLAPGAHDGIYGYGGRVFVQSGDGMHNPDTSTGRYARVSRVYAEVSD